MILSTFFFISSDHNLNINQFSADGIILYKGRVAFITKYNQITGCGFYTTQQGKNVYKSFLKWFRETIFVVPIAFSILYNMLLYCTNIWHCFGKNKKLKYQARQSWLGGTARQWLLYPTLLKAIVCCHLENVFSNPYFDIQTKLFFETYSSFRYMMILHFAPNLKKMHFCVWGILRILG